MSEPLHWNLFGPRLSEDEQQHLMGRLFATVDEFAANVLRRCELNGMTVTGTVVSVGQNQADFRVSGIESPEAMNEMAALEASMELYHFLVTGEQIIEGSAEIGQVVEN